MNATLLDEQGTELTHITAHPGASDGLVLVDWAMRPDALFRHYFDRGRRAVTLLSDTERYLAMLGTRWQMGSRFWFLRTFDLVMSQPGSTLESSIAAASIPSMYARGGNANLVTPAMERTAAPPDAPT